MEPKSLIDRFKRWQCKKYGHKVIFTHYFQCRKVCKCRRCGVINFDHEFERWELWRVQRKEGKRPLEDG